MWRSVHEDVEQLCPARAAEKNIFQWDKDEMGTFALQKLWSVRQLLFEKLPYIHLRDDSISHEWDRHILKKSDGSKEKIGAGKSTSLSVRTFSLSPSFNEEFPLKLKLILICLKTFLDSWMKTS